MLKKITKLQKILRILINSNCELRPRNQKKGIYCSCTFVLITICIITLPLPPKDLYRAFQRSTNPVNQILVDNFPADPPDLDGS